MRANWHRLEGGVRTAWATSEAAGEDAILEKAKEVGVGGMLASGLGIQNGKQMVIE